MPAIERLDLNDKVDEVILAANSIRLALSPYEEALGFQRLINKTTPAAGHHNHAVGYPAHHCRCCR